jgi:hypothetical protein
MIQISQPSTGDEEWQAVREPLATGWLTQGPKVAEFEKRFAARHQVKHALAATSCTTALHLILAAMEIGPGDEVIVPAFTWVATANVVVYCGATPVFADVDRATYNLDPGDVARKVTPRTKAIIAVRRRRRHSARGTGNPHHRGCRLRRREHIPRTVCRIARIRSCLLVSPTQVDHHRRGRDGHDTRRRAGREGRDAA